MGTFWGPGGLYFNLCILEAVRTQLRPGLTVSDKQKSCKANRESPNTSPAQFLLLAILYICVVHLSPLTNQYGNIMTDWNALFRLPLFLTVILFQFRDPIPDTTWHLVIKALKASLSSRGFSAFPCFSWPVWRGRVSCMEEMDRLAENLSTGIFLMFFL